MELDALGLGVSNSVFTKTPEDSDTSEFEKHRLREN